MLTMEEAMRQAGTMPFATGNIVKGTIIEVRPKEVLVDIGYKSEGVISGGEFEDLKTVKVGDEIDVLIEKLEDKEGMVVLSKEKAEFKKNWERILTICNEGGTINGKVKAVVKGGLLVNIGVEAFLPASQIDISTPKNLAQYVGNSYDFKVVKINQERQNIVLSRRELIEQERTERRQKLLAEMTPGDIRKGTVKNITDFGVFVDLGGVEGLIHLSELSWGRVHKGTEIVRIGDLIRVMAATGESFEECIKASKGFDLYLTCYQFMKNPQREAMLDAIRRWHAAQIEGAFTAEQKAAAEGGEAPAEGGESTLSPESMTEYMKSKTVAFASGSFGATDTFLMIVNVDRR